MSHRICVRVVLAGLGVLLLATTLATAQSGPIVSYTVAADGSALSYPGQSVTTPAGGPFNNIAFNFYACNTARLYGRHSSGSIRNVVYLYASLHWNSGQPRSGDARLFGAIRWNCQWTVHLRPHGDPAAQHPILLLCEF